MKTHRIQIMVCTGTGCVSNHAFEIKEALEKEISKHNLDAEAYIATTGCNGFCGAGPIAVVQPDGIFYQLLKTSDIPLLVEEHLLKGRHDADGKNNRTKDVGDPIFRRPDPYSIEESRIDRS
jgi:(2Fe-2S) ferredoxin